MTMISYIIGPGDNHETAQWSSDLGRRLETRLETLPMRTPVNAEEVQGYVQQIVDAEVRGSLEDALERRHLEREQLLRFQLFLSKAGLSGMLTYSYRVDLNPYRLICTGCSGFISTGSARPEEG